MTSAVTIAWILLNLVISNYLLDFLPANAGRFIIGMWSPALTAVVFLVAARHPVGAGLSLRVGFVRAYAIGAVVPVLVAGLTVGLGFVGGYLRFNDAYTFTPGSALPTLIVWVLASLGEELGWRGYLHSRLRQHKHAPLLIGLVWAAWHYRQSFSESGPVHTLLVFTPAVILTSFVLSDLVERGTSVWPCALYHGVWNFLRLKVLFGNPAAGTGGLFNSTAPHLTEMEGVFGLLALLGLSVPFIRSWYQRPTRPG